jgi:hypothetical protein
MAEMQISAGSKNLPLDNTLIYASDLILPGAPRSAFILDKLRFFIRFCLAVSTRRSALGLLHFEIDS